MAKAKLILSILVLLSSGTAWAGKSKSGRGGGVVNLDGRNVKLRDLADRLPFQLSPTLPQRVRDAIAQISTGAQNNPNDEQLSRIALLLPGLAKRKIYYTTYPLNTGPQYDRFGYLVSTSIPNVLKLRPGEIWLNVFVAEDATIEQISSEIVQELRAELKLK